MLVSFKKKKKKPQMGWFKLQMFIFSQFWGLEVQGVFSPGSPLALAGGWGGASVGGAALLSLPLLRAAVPSD